MKTFAATLLLVSSLLAFLTAPVTGRAAETSTPTWKNRGGVISSSTLIGARVTDADGKTLGRLTQLMVDPRNGRLTHAVVGMGGFAGLGERQVVIPWSTLRAALHLDPEGDTVVIQMSQAALDRAPKFDAEAASNTSNRTIAPSASPSSTPRPRDRSAK